MKINGKKKKNASNKPVIACLGVKELAQRNSADSNQYENSNRFLVYLFIYF